MNSRDGEELDAVRKEVEILKNLNFGYIVTYVKSFEDNEAGRIYIVMEYCEGGDLSKVMEKHQEERFFEEQQILDWLVQICLALQYLHEQKILHRDIKPQNIFLTEDGYINLGDFGCSKALERADEYANSVVGAKLYVSPEVYQKKYNSKSDIWSLGWLLHDLCMLDVWVEVPNQHLQCNQGVITSPPYPQKKQLYYYNQLSQSAGFLQPLPQKRALPLNWSIS
uniref:non-specific serine/threonine protein kinase n=1 Tax=Cyprinus carpio TaxID=7962 RepID=A0A8C1M4Q0_CYPCA